MKGGVAMGKGTHASVQKSQQIKRAANKSETPKQKPNKMTEHATPRDGGGGPSRVLNWKIK